MDANERAKALIDELDTIAREVCEYDYGLPIGNDEAEPKMISFVADAIRAAVAEERERCLGVVRGTAVSRDELGADIDAGLRDAIATAIREVPT